MTKLTLSILLFGLAPSLLGCSGLAYYGQAASGHWRLLGLRRPLEAVQADPATAPALRERLAVARRLRDFASFDLALPDNGSYREYADLQRPYVVRNVFAAPELSLQPRQWCFPVVGCVAYRGYFSAAAAQAFAEALRARGDDVYVGNVPAYSTLGWFDDPLLNTFIHWPVGRLAELMFHELAHQRLFIDDDTAFNESFATAVGQLGARRWLAQHATAQERADYETYHRRQEGFLTLVLAVRDELAGLYASSQSEAAKRAGKRRILADLQQRYQALKPQWDGYAGYDPWFAEDLNNAKLASLNTYTRYVPAFEVLFQQAGGEFAAFYRAAEALGRLAPPVRTAQLQALMKQHPSAPAVAALP